MLISSFIQITQWLERVHGKHEVVGSNPIRDPIYMEPIKMNNILAQNEYHIYQIYQQIPLHIHD